MNEKKTELEKAIWYTPSGIREQLFRIFIDDKDREDIEYALEEGVKNYKEWKDKDE